MTTNEGAGAPDPKLERLAELLRGLPRARRDAAVHYIEKNMSEETETNNLTSKATGTATASDLKQLSLRLPTGLVARLDAHAARLSQSTPGLTVTRTDAIRVLLLDALAHAEADHGASLETVQK